MAETEQGAASDLARSVGLTDDGALVVATEGDGSVRERVVTAGDVHHLRLAGAVSGVQVAAWALGMPTGHSAVNFAATLLFPVPGAPETSTLLPRNTPPPSMASRRSKPAEIRSLDARCSISAGSAAPTSMPEGPMKRKPGWRACKAGSGA